MTAMDIDIYARISDDQLDDAHGTNNQISDCKAYATDRGWTVVDVYRDDSVSATSGKRRPGFEALLNRPIKRPVLVWHTDRLIRLTEDLNRIIKLDMTVYALHAGLVDLSTETGKAVARTVTAWAEHEVRLKSQRQMAANRAQAAAGKPRWRSAPYGHTTEGKIVPHEAQVIREAAERILGGHSVNGTKRWLQSVPGAPRTNVQRFLMSPRLAGHNVYKGERINESKIAPIVDEDTYSDLMRLLTDPARRTSGVKGGKVATLLTGIAQCGICGDGSTVHSRLDMKGKVKIPVYRCSVKGHNQHKQNVADSIVIVRTVELLTRPDAAKVIERHSVTPEIVKDELRDLRAQLAEWQLVASEMGPVEYMKVTKPIRERIAELDEISRQTSHRDLFDGLTFDDEWSQEKADEWAYEAHQRFDALPLLKQREI
ncbi:MAG: hypothetical protein JWQ70_2578, partial [Aeromicrobium sp.]|nr:hypothetical protein [Aeromicrobium sp.]